MNTLSKIQSKNIALGKRIGNTEKKVIKAALPDKLVTKAKNAAVGFMQDRKTAQKNWENRTTNKNYSRSSSYWKDHTN